MHVQMLIYFSGSMEGGKLTGKAGNYTRIYKLGHSECSVPEIMNVVQVPFSVRQIDNGG